jgi:hypothetical protein
MCIPLFSIFLTDVDFPVHSTFKSEKVSTHIESREIVNIYKDNIVFMLQVSNVIIMHNVLSYWWISINFWIFYLISAAAIISQKVL